MLPFTAQQQAIIRSNAPRICARARAGTGKTTTLVGYAQARPDERMLYLAYNRSVQMAAAQKFPPNVVAKTTHAIAMEAVGKPYRPKLGNLWKGEIAQLLTISGTHASQVADTLQNYLNSADEAIGPDHLPPRTNRKNFLDYETVLEGAQRLWTRMQDVGDMKAKMSHDGYLKIFQMRKPLLDRYRYLLYDEFQDANPQTTEIVRNHRGPVVLIGDENQAIYGWRGARDALKQIAVDETYSLTESFRFGAGVAACANAILSWHGAGDLLIGAGPETRWDIDRERPYAQIARTNMALIAAAIGALKDPRPLHFVTGVENYRLGLIEDTWRLYCKRQFEIKDPHIKRFASIDALAAEAEETHDTELLLVVKIVETYGNHIPDILQQLRRRCVDSMEHAHRIFSTTHRAKGLEFDQVELLPDYNELLENGIPIDPWEIDPQSVNLMYVAVTRAREALVPSPQILDWWEYVDRKTCEDAQRSTAETAAA